MNLFNDISRLLGEYGSIQAPTHDENRNLFNKIIHSDKDTEVDQYIISNTRLVASALLKFLKRHPSSSYLIDDMFSTGLCIMVEATKFLVKYAREYTEKFLETIGREDENGYFYVSMYLYVAIYRGIQKTYEFDSVMPISQRTIERFTPEGKEEPVKRVMCSNWNFSQISCDTFEITYLFEDIIDVCENDWERDIITKRLTMNDYDIAKSLGCSHQTVLRVRKEIFKRYQLSSTWSAQNDRSNFS